MDTIRISVVFQVVLQQGDGVGNRHPHDPALPPGMRKSMAVRLAARMAAGLQPPSGTDVAVRID
jgi:hypothetical protein